MDAYLTFQLGVAAFGRRDYRAAVEHFTDVLDQFGEHTEAREYLARAHYHRASLASAERECRTLLEHDPTNEYVLLLLARSLERQNRADEAEPVRRCLAVVSGEVNHLAAHTLAG